MQQSIKEFNSPFPVFYRIQAPVFWNDVFYRKVFVFLFNAPVVTGLPVVRLLLFAGKHRLDDSEDDASQEKDLHFV